jgi:hypothetical protein
METLMELGSEGSPSEFNLQTWRKVWLQERHQQAIWLFSGHQFFGSLN